MVRAGDKQSENTNILFCPAPNYEKCSNTSQDQYSCHDPSQSPQVQKKSINVKSWIQMSQNLKDLDWNQWRDYHHYH